MATVPLRHERGSNRADPTQDVPDSHTPPDGQGPHPNHDGQGPHIAIPSDIYHDFEALKSLTKLDTGNLMRKLLKDYQRMTSSNQASRERRLDDVIGDLVAARTTSILDLSKKGPAPYVCQASGSANSPVADDKIVMGMCSNDADDAEMEDDAGPLDLTLHKLDQAASPDSAIVEDITTKFTTSTPTYSQVQNTESNTRNSLKTAGSYVINLESASTEGTSSNLSTLSQILSLGSPSNSSSKHNSNTTDVSGSLWKTAKRTSESYTSETKPSSSKPHTTLVSTLSFQQQLVSTHKLGGLPSYTEALNSVLNSQKQPKKPQVNADTNTAEIQTPTQEKLSMTNNGLSFFQIHTEDADFKFIPFNLNPQLMTSPLSEQQHKSFMAQKGTNEQKPPQSSQQVSSDVTTFQMLPMQATKQDNPGSPKFVKSSEFPNFLMDPQTMRTSTMSDPQTSMSMPAFFVTSTTNGVSNMVAIPLLHTLPEGITGLQPFAFAPHPSPVSTSSMSVSSPQMMSTPPHIAVSDVNKPNINTEPYPSSDNANQSIKTSPQSPVFNMEPLPSPTQSQVRSKPGRPRGRGGRGSSQRSQNKDMKLLTENTLFPGVYTSILKLPWSRRSRNKSKVKTVSELKREAQIVAQDKLNETACEMATTDTHRLHVDVQNCDSFLEERRESVDLATAKHIHEHSLTAVQRQQILDEELQQQSIHAQKQKDLEQQQRLHAQYHLRLQEEQRKLTKQIEMSYLATPGSLPSSVSFSMLSQSSSPIKQDDINNELPQSISPGQMSPSCHLLADVLHGKQLIPQSKDPMMMVYSSVDPLKSSPRKRGRPPKTPTLPRSTEETSLDGTPNASFSSVPPDNFLNLTAPQSTLNTATVNMTFTPKTELPFHHSFEHENVTTLTPKLETQSDNETELALDQKMSFLSNSLMLGNPQQMSHLDLPDLPPAGSSEAVEGNFETSDTRKDELTFNEPRTEVKPRRKKVSRLLKSNENFIYATFKIKPKNGSLMPRKTRKKRKDVLATTAAAAETIANLRQKKLQDAANDRADKQLAMVAWKFHEQYPCLGDETGERSDPRSVCVTCGALTPLGGEEFPHSQCSSCIQESSIPGDQHKMNCDTETRAECCVTCGRIFQKHYSDPSSRCETCVRTMDTSIKSSKLFSFHDSPTTSTTSSYPLDCSLSTPTTTSSSIVSQLMDVKFAGLKTAKVSNNHLFCSLCRMEFTKICDYLSHIRDVHENKLAKPQQWHEPLQTDITKKIKSSKTKKSLAHKTLTCPVEDCPHFFREQKDLDMHFVKKHSSLGTCSHIECAFTYTSREELENHLRCDHGVTTITAGSNPSEDSPAKLPDKPGVASAVSEKPLRCEFCDYRCRQKNALTWHMRKHPEAASLYRRYSGVNSE